MNAHTPVSIITGASRGLGLGIARELLRRGHCVLTLQRSPNPALVAEAADRKAVLEQWAVDLTRPAEVAARLKDWVQGLPRAGLASLDLINNAALLVEPGPLAQADPDGVAAAMRVSLEAPLLLTSAFLAASADLTVPRKVLNISSGLGRFAMAGSAVYCAAKAGLDHFSRALALEEGERAHGARIVSLAPGVIDTDMQVQLRGADPSRFSSRGRFADLKAQGQLDSIDAAAAKVLACLEAEDFGQKVIADVRDLPPS
ncbi:MAG: SDR family NAD(P)-dependent oxidoreductase [Rubrivivax sp.]|jgi:benzil reductase ((S)-benzoin forming)